MKISIITAVYNRQATIGQAIESVQAQTYPDVEHLIIDGASTDNTLGEVERRQSRAMKISSGPDNGVYDAINKGIALATGDVVGLLHSDDFLVHERVLEHIVAAFAESGADAVYGDLEYVLAGNPERVVRHWQAGEFCPSLLARGWMPPHPTLFLRRHVFERWGAYDTSYRIAADYDAILRWFSKDEFHAFYIPDVLTRMRLGGESNGSLKRIVRKSREDLRALRANGIGGFGTLAMKNITKLGQFFTR